MQKEHHAEQTFDDVDQAIKQYYYITGKQLDPPEPNLSDDEKELIQPKGILERTSRSRETTKRSKSQ